MSNVGAIIWFGWLNLPISIIVSKKLETSLIYGTKIEIGFKSLSSSKIKIEVFFNYFFRGKIGMELRV
jgi:hypothetical protein